MVRKNEQHTYNHEEETIDIHVSLMVNLKHVPHTCNREAQIYTVNIHVTFGDLFNIAVVVSRLGI